MTPLLMDRRQWGDDRVRDVLRVKLLAGFSPLQLAREYGVGKRRMQKVIAELGLGAKERSR